MPRFLFTSAATVILAASASVGCATKGFVTETVADQVDTVARRVAEVEADVAETSAATRTLDNRLGEVDQTASSALETAMDAEAEAKTAQDTADEALTTTARLEAAAGRLMHELVLAEDHDQFGFGDATLPESAMTRLDELVDRYREHPGGIHLEIQGHTDATGPTEINTRLGLERADAVKHYLYATHQVPLHKMSVISFGEQTPVAPNDTREGRAQNRRVVVRVLGVEPGSRVATTTDAPRPPAEP